MEACERIRDNFRDETVHKKFIRHEENRAVVVINNHGDTVSLRPDYVVTIENILGSTVRLKMEREQLRLEALMPESGEALFRRIPFIPENYSLRSPTTLEAWIAMERVGLNGRL